jgi:hypothetical protein
MSITGNSWEQNGNRKRHTFLRLVFTINSRARCWIGAGSSGRKTMLLSRGSPGTIAQWSKTDWQNAWPCVWYLKSVSKPKDSITGKNAWKMWRTKSVTLYSKMPQPSKKAKPCYISFYGKVSYLNKISRGAWLRNISSDMSTPTRQHSVDRRYTVYWCLNLIQRPKEQ